MMAMIGARVSAVVLAAGRSTRIGEAKQLLALGSGTVLERTLGNVIGSGVEEIVLVLGFLAGEIQRSLSDELRGHVKVVVNRDYEQGMASSLRAGIGAVSEEMDAALVVLADQPFVRAETMRRIVAGYRGFGTKGTGARIVIPVYEGKRGNPVLLDRAMFEEAMGLQGDTGYRAIFGRHAGAIQEVEVDDEGVLIDIDSREDYERLRDGDGSAR
jgi:molybdenum cofactor cytidylyltransferase